MSVVLVTPAPDAHTYDPALISAITMILCPDGQNNGKVFKALADKNRWICILKTPFILRMLNGWMF